MSRLLYWHRLIALSGMVLLLYVVATGVGIQLSDMRALMTGVPATDPDMVMMRTHIQGDEGFAVVSPQDYSALPLPATLDYAAALAKAAALGHAAAPEAPLMLVEVRRVGSAVAGRVRTGGRDLLFDLANGRRLPDAAVPPPFPNDMAGSARMGSKKFHQMRALGPLGALFSTLAGLALGGLIVTGLWQYAKLLRRRRAMKKTALTWRGGGRWRELHRAVAVFAGVVLVWIVATGIAVAVDGVGHSFWMARGPHSAPDPASPLADALLPGMARVTQAAFARSMPDTGIRVMRLRRYAGYSQGVVIADDAAADQLVYNGASGVPTTMTEPGYPDTGFPFGWEWHQRLKRLHRGDFFGMTGRWLVTLGALSLLYLTVSGMVMYWEAWRRRHRGGRRALIWR